MNGLDADQLTGYMRDTVALSLTEVERGGIPFSGFVVHSRAGVLGTGVNRVFVERDPTAHAEIVALRDAAKRHDRVAISESVLFASGEPCGMCYQAAYEAGIGSVLYAVSADDAAAYGFDYRASYLHVDRTDGGRVTPEPFPVDDALTPFTTWAARHR
ncbi:nucleoside deaminase [Actinokineospora inagensis]|uniref:nucleoside deaminase n=1 Tax=Actinokineospora inagensis TaxID=103730 RepID=UPI00040A0470|nr:nucleoside deaminase [Actinokineospora inagensis]